MVSRIPSATLYPNMDLYMKDVQFFKNFNIAWIFSWEYWLQPFLPHPYPLSLVRIYKVKWWPEFKYDKQQKNI